MSHYSASETPMTESFPATETSSTEGMPFLAALSPVWDPFGEARILAETAAEAERSMMAFVLNEVSRQVGDAEVRDQHTRLERITRRVKAEAARTFVATQLRRACDFLWPARVHPILTLHLPLDLVDDGNQSAPEVHQSPGHAAATSASAPNAPPSITAASLSVGVVAMAA